ncbi:glycerophosphodiester phosphodiesterase [Streptomyces sp. NPDC054796]
MSMRPAVAATTGALLGMSALILSASPSHAAPQRADKTEPPTTVAHRGASGHAPENTLAAVDKAHKLGISWVENDVQRTKDGKLVVMHDTTLDRTTNAEKVFPDRSPWNVSDFTSKEIAKLDAGSWFSASYQNQKVPTLDQYLDRVTRNGQKLLMELKAPELYPGIEAQVLKELTKKGWLDGRHLKSKLVVQSFNADSVKKIHGLKPALKTGFLGNPPKNELKTYAGFADQINPKYTTVSKEYVDAIHSVKGPHGKPLETYAWTVNDAATARKVADAGVDGIISNYPDVIRQETGG